MWIAGEAVRPAKCGLLCGSGHNLPTPAHTTSRGPGSASQESKAANLLHTERKVPESRLLMDHRTNSWRSEALRPPAPHALACCGLRAESEQSPRGNHQRLQSQTCPWRAGKCLPPASSHGGEGKGALSQLFPSELQARTTKINSMGTSLKLDQAARNPPAALKSIALNPGHFQPLQQCWGSGGLLMTRSGEDL